MVTPRRLNARDEYAEPYYPRQGGGSLQQQHHYGYNLARNQPLPPPQYQAAKPPSLGEPASTSKTFSAVIKPPGAHEPGVQSPLGKQSDQRQQLQHLNQPAYLPIQRMLANSVSVFPDASLISRIVRTDEVRPEYFYEDTILRKSREERQRYHILTSLRSSPELSEEDQLRLKLERETSNLASSDSFDPTSFPVYFKHPRKLWLRDLLFLIQSENDPVFRQLSKCWEDSEPEKQLQPGRK